MKHKIADYEINIELRQPVFGGVIHKPNEVADKATVTHQLSVFIFSRFPDETQWYCDALFSSKGLPVFVHGHGSRCCMKQTPIEAMRKAIETAYKLTMEADASERN